MAERQGFEPWRRSSRLHALQACSFNHSDISPPVTANPEYRKPHRATQGAKSGCRTAARCDRSQTQKVLPSARLASRHCGGCVWRTWDCQPIVNLGRYWIVNLQRDPSRGTGSTHIDSDAGGHRFDRKNWRRERDSNPRWSYPHNGFRDRRLQPLGHLSALHNCLRPYKFGTNPANPQSVPSAVASALLLSTACRTSPRTA